jgi:hypothetical protein
MTRLHSLLCLSSLAVFSLACSPKETEEEMLERTAVDVRVPIPAADPKFIDFVGAEKIIKSGEDSMTCTHLLYQGEDLAYDLADTLQGKFGHHFVILKAKNPLPPGTSEDCSKPEDMAKFDILTMPSFELSANQAFMMRKGTPIVMQSHYVNTGKDPIRTRDLLRFRRVDAAKVTTWAAAAGSYLEKFEIKPGEQATRSYDCVVPRDYKSILFGGHMHEWGKKFVLSYAATPADTMKELYRVDEWIAHYRDDPPTLLMTKNPMDLPKGSVLRVECTWFNDTKESLSHPHEMCTTFGVLLGSQEPWLCKGDK